RSAAGALARHDERRSGARRADARAPAARTLTRRRVRELRMDDPVMSRPEPARRVAVPGVSGYVERIGVPAGQSARFHVNSPSAYEFSIVRLGQRAILDATAGEPADRADVEVISTRRHASATPQTLSAGPA